MPRLRRVALLSIVAVLSAGPSVARADDDSPEKAQARTLLGQGNALFEKGDLRGALVNFRAAYALYPSPKLLVNAAAAERELGDLAAAANDLRHFVDDAVDSQEDPFLVEKARQDLKALEKKVGRATFAGWPPRSTFDVDGRLLRDPAYLKPGERHHLKARTPGGSELERDLTVGANEAIEIPPPPLSHEPAAAATVGAAPPHKSRWWIGVVVGSVALVAAGVGLGVGLGLQPAQQPLRGDLGSVKFSDFH